VKIEVTRRIRPGLHFEAFGDAHGLTLNVTQQDWGWSVRFDRVEVMEDGMLRSAYGKGPSPQEAVCDYARQIAGRRLVVHAMSPLRYEFEAPSVWLSLPKLEGV
jgi:hypothetical protein